MFNKDEKTTYYISNLGTNKVSIIDGNNYSFIKDIEIGPRPQDIVVDEDNNVYIASDREGVVALIDDLYEVSKRWKMPSNGKIKVDSKSKTIYVCNTEEVNIYSLKTGEKIKTLKDFFVADGLELDKDKKRLFILDILKNEIKVYDTLNFTLIKNYQEVGSAPRAILIDESEKYIYIANKEINKRNKIENISILNINNGNISYINLEKGSDITSLEQNGKTLYAANRGLGRIEVINILKRETTTSIKTTLEKIQKIKIIKDKNILLALSNNKEGKAVIDKIDMTKNNIIDTFNFEGENNIPFDIGMVRQKNIKAREDYFIFKGSEEKEDKEKGISLLAKRIISTYQEKIIFQETLVEVLKKDNEIIEIEDIVFEKCEVIDESKDRRIIENRKDYSIFTYDFNIPYYINVRSNLEEKYLIKGIMKGTQRTSLYIPKDSEEKGFEILISSLSKVINTPIIIDKTIKFDISTLISTKVIVEEDVFIPFCSHCEGVKGEKKND